MKNTACKTLIALALVLLALAPAYAQKTYATVNIPFTFTVDDVRMPAGEYIISSPSERVVNLQHVGGPEAKATMTNNGSSTNLAASCRVCRFPAFAARHPADRPGHDFSSDSTDKSAFAYPVVSASHNSLRLASASGPKCCALLKQADKQKSASVHETLPLRLAA